jgi:hypothetical protein
MDEYELYSVATRSIILKNFMNKTIEIYENILTSSHDRFLAKKIQL